MKVGVLNLENSNAPAVNSVLEKLGYPSYLTCDSDDLAELSHLIIPGVGSFAAVVGEVKAKPSLSESISAFASNGKPLLGICLGMQLLGESSDESPGVSGLGILDFKAVTMKNLSGQFPIPHVGWNQIDIKTSSPLFEGIPSGTDFYFSHSFQVTESSFGITHTNYGEQFISSVSKENIYGVQFHPERSQEFGHRVLENFLKI